MSAAHPMIPAIGAQQGKVTALQNALADPAINTDPQKMMETSMQLMQETQKLTIMSEGHTKAEKAKTDGMKAAITNMH